MTSQCKKYISPTITIQLFHSEAGFAASHITPVDNELHLVDIDIPESESTLGYQSQGNEASTYNKEQWTW